jgi:hypothetical protein
MDKKNPNNETEQNDNIPMDDFQREFLNLRGKYVHNPEMETAIALSEKGKEKNGDGMKFGYNPLPWQEPMKASENAALVNAKNKTMICPNKNCAASGENGGGVNYQMVTHTKKEKHANDLMQDLYGDKITNYHHVGALCKACGTHIRLVRYTKTNRRAAGDFWVVGPQSKSNR